MRATGLACEGPSALLLLCSVAVDPKTFSAPMANLMSQYKDQAAVLKSAIPPAIERVAPTVKGSDDRTLNSRL